MVSTAFHRLKPDEYYEVLIDNRRPFVVGIHQAVTTANSDSLDSDFVAFRGPDQWWPWWAWLLFGLVLLCCICPLAACIYYYRPGHADPPSPSGAGGGPGMFGGSTRGSTGKEIGKGGGGGNADWIAQQYEKGGGSGGYGDKDFNDAATGISVSIFFLPSSTMVCVRACVRVWWRRWGEGSDFCWRAG